MTGSVTTIRDYADGDAAFLWPLLERGLAPYGLEVDPATTDRDMFDIRGAYLDNGGRFRVLVNETGIIGMYGLFNEGEGAVELRKMYLDPQQKGKGYGKRMLEDALELARTAGFTRMVLETSSRLREAIGLYRKYGFVDIEPGTLASRCDLAMAVDLTSSKAGGV